MASFNVKKGDYAMIIAGSDKGKPCVIVGIDSAKRRALIEGKNLDTVIKKHVKARKASDRSGIIEQPGTIDLSNLMPICAACGKPTRVRHREVDGKKQRICAKCDAVLVTKRPTEKKAKASVRRKSAVAAEKAAEKAAEQAATQTVEQAVKQGKAEVVAEPKKEKAKVVVEPAEKEEAIVEPEEKEEAIVEPAEATEADPAENAEQSDDAATEDLPSNDKE